MHCFVLLSRFVVYVCICVQLSFVLTLIRTTSHERQWDERDDERLILNMERTLGTPSRDPIMIHKYFGISTINDSFGHPR